MVVLSFAVSVWGGRQDWVGVEAAMLEIVRGARPTAGQVAGGGNYMLINESRYGALELRERGAGHVPWLVYRMEKREGTKGRVMRRTFSGHLMSGRLSMTLRVFAHRRAEFRLTPSRSPSSPILVPAHAVTNKTGFHFDSGSCSCTGPFTHWRLHRGTAIMWLEKQFSSHLLYGRSASSASPSRLFSTASRSTPHVVAMSFTFPIHVLTTGC